MNFYSTISPLLPISVSGVDHLPHPALPLSLTIMTREHVIVHFKNERSPRRTLEASLSTLICVLGLGGQ